MARKKPKKPKGYMGHTFDTKVKIPAAANTTISANPATGSYTCGAGTTLLTVAMIYNGSVARTGGVPKFNNISGTMADQKRSAPTSAEASSELWYWLSPTTSPSVVVVPNAGGLNLDIFVSSYKAQAGYTSQLDVAAGTGSTAANPNVTLNTTTNGDVIVGVVGSGLNLWNPTAAQHSGTALYDEDAGTWGGGAQYILQTTAGTIQCAWIEDSDDYGAVAAAFKEFSSGTETKSLTDTGAGTDRLSSLSASLSRSDNGAGVDNPNLAASLGLSDVALGGDLLDLSATLSQIDAGISSDIFGTFHPLSYDNFPLTPILDNFNRTTLAPNWSKYSGTAGYPTVVDNAFTVTGSNLGVILWEGGNFDASLEFYFDVLGLNSTSGSANLVHYGKTSMSGGTDAPYQIFRVDNLSNSSVRLQGRYILPGESETVVADSGNVIFDPIDNIKVGIRHQLNGQINLFLNSGNGWENIGSGSNTIGFTPGHIRWLLAVFPATEVPWISGDNFGGGNLPYPSIFVSDSINETSSGQETLNLSASLSVNDVGTGLDEILVAIETIVKSICDYGIGIDAPELFGWLVDECAALFDSNGNPLVDGTVGEELYIRITALLSLLDNASATDTTSISASIPVVDIGLSNETITLSATLSLNDTGTGLDEVSVSVAEAILKTISDVASALDNISISATLSTTETSTGQDALSLSVSLSLVDTASGVDSPDIAATLGIIDTALGGDFLGLSALLQLVDSGIGSDRLSNLLASLSIGDNALGTDEINVLAGLLIAISEFGAGSDEVANILASLSVAELGTITEVISQLASLSLSDISVAIDDPQIAASLGITEGALGGDFIDLSASLSLSEAGSGIDTLNQLLASLLLSESGNADDLLQLLASLSVGDLGGGSDEISVLAGVIKSILDSGLGSDEVSISVNLSVQETSTGSDALSISVSLSVLDTGTGVDTETVNKVEILFKSISDLASGSDNLSISAILNVGETVIGIDDPAILASLSIEDLSETFDSPVISASLTITDTASATDLISILQSILKQIADTGTGTDAIGQITASIPVSETGLGTDQIGQLLASLLVTDFGTGVDVVVKYDTTTQIIKISFIIKNNTISFAMKANNINFDLNTSSIVTDTNDPTIGITFSAPSISFSLNPDGG